ncbi:hypothetical protein, partial [Leptospira interrogans]
ENPNHYSKRTKLSSTYLKTNTYFI